MSTVAPSAPVPPAQPIATAPQPTPPPTGDATRSTTQAPQAPSSPLADTPEPAVVTGARQSSPQPPQPTSLAPGTVVTAVLEQPAPTPPVVAESTPPPPPDAPPTTTTTAEEAPSASPPSQAAPRPTTAQAPAPTSAPTPAPAPPPSISLPTTATPAPQVSPPQTTAPAPQAAPVPTSATPQPAIRPAVPPTPAAALATLLSAVPARPAPPPPAPSPAGAPLPTSAPTAAAPTAPTQTAAPPASAVSIPPSSAAPPTQGAPIPQSGPRSAAPPALQPTPQAAPAGVPGAATLPPTPATSLPAAPPSSTAAPPQTAPLPGGDLPEPLRTPASSPTPRPGTTATPPIAAETVPAAPPSSAGPGAPAVAPPPTEGAATPLSGTPVLALRPGTALLLQVAEMTPRVPGTAPAQAQGLTLTVKDGQMSFGGTVMGQTIAGQPIVETPLGLFTLGARVDLPEGMRLQLRVMAPPGTAGAGAAGGQPATLMELSRQWAALDEALATLRAADPQAAQRVLDQTIARPGPQLAGGLAFFLVALRGGGDLKRWLGESSVQALEKSGRGKLVQQLSEEMREMARAGSSDASQPGDWRPLFMPVFDGEGVRQLRLYVHRDAEHGEDENESGKRFLVDADFTRLGQLQLDGFVAGKRLDLVVRTKAALPGDITKNINAIFTRSLDASGFAGRLRFEAGPKMVTPDPDALFGHAPTVSA